MSNNQSNFLKIVMAMAKQNPNVPEEDAIAFLKYNPHKIVGKDGYVLVSAEDIQEILEALGESPDCTRVGQTVSVEVDGVEASGPVKSIRYQIEGLGNKYYSDEDIK